MSTGFARIVEISEDLPRELGRAQRSGVQQSALTVTRGIRSTVRAASGGDNRLSGVGRRGARVGAKYDVKGSTNPTAIIRATGPMQLIEHPTRPHGITRRKRRRKAGRGALKLADGSFRASTRHPGTSPSKPFERGYLATRDDAGRAYDLAMQGAIRRVIR